VVPVVAPPRARNAGVILVNPMGQLLLQLRTGDALVDPGKWGIPGGKVDPGELPQDGALRELHEETGLYVGHAELYRKGVFEDTEWWAFYAPWLLGNHKVQCFEGQAMLWVPPDQVPRLEFGRLLGTIVPGFIHSDLYQAHMARYGRI
jgi:8-oxo-dGTP diphosphatase